MSGEAFGPAEFIIAADTIHTMDDGEPAPTFPTAIAISGGRIIAVGDRSQISQWSEPGTVVTDFGAATVTPGLSDGHSHPLMGAQMTTGADLTGARSVREAVGLIAAEAESLPTGAWVYGWGLAPEALEGAEAHRRLIDDATIGHPALIRLFDGHSLLCNTEALGLAGITGAREFDQGAIIVVDEDGEPTGKLVEEAAMILMDQVRPEPSPDELLASFLRALTEMSKSGLTSAHVMDFAGEPFELLEAAEGITDLPLRLTISPWCSPGSTEEEWNHLARLQGRRGRRWEISGVKFFMDGTVDNGTAWLEHPDRNGESARSFWPDPEEYSRAVEFFASRGIPTATHAIGDAAVAHVLDTIENLPPSSSAVTHRIEHIETVPDELLARFAELSVVASMQPTHCTHFAKSDHSDNWSFLLGDERADRGWRTRDLRDAGATLALGSDWPIAPFDPREIMADAQLRRRAGEPTAPEIGAAQALTARMALEGYTSHAARADGRFGDTGVIRVGARADLTVWAADPLLLDPDDLALCAIEATLIDGQFVHAPELQLS